MTSPPKDIKVLYPACNFKVYHQLLIVRDDGVWEMNPPRQPNHALQPTKVVWGIDAD